MGKIARFDWIVLILTMLAAFALSWVVTGHVEYVTSDSFDYLWGAVHLNAGNGYLSPYGAAPQLYYPPMYSILMTVLSPVISDTFLAGQIVSIVGSTLSIFVLYLLMKRWFSSKAALLGCALFALMPFRIYTSQLIMTEACQTLFIPAILFFYLKCKENKIFVPITGMMIGAAYLLRDENTIYFLLVAGHQFFFGAAVLRKRIVTIFVMALFALLVAFPWPAHLYKWTGKVSVTTKFYWTWQTGTHIYKYNRILGQMLDETGLKVTHPPKENDSFSDVVERYSHNLKKEAAKLVYHTGSRFVTGPLLLLGLGVLFRYRRRENSDNPDDAAESSVEKNAFEYVSPLWLSERWLCAAFYLIPLICIFPLFHIYDRFLAPHLLFCAICLILGLIQLKKWSHKRSFLLMKWLIVGIPLVLVLSYGLRIYITMQENNGVLLEKKVSDWISEKGLGHAKIMKVLPQEIYFRTGAEPVLLPMDANLDQVLRYAKSNNVKYWVISTVDLTTEATRAVLNNPSARPEIKLLHTVLDERHQIQVYELFSNNSARSHV